MSRKKDFIDKVTAEENNAPLSNVIKIDEKSEDETILTQIAQMWRTNHLACFSAIFILILILIAIFAPLIAPYGYADQDLLSRLAAPSFAHPLGTDELGRDILSRIIYGSRVSLCIGLFPTFISIVIGMILGLIAGYYGGVVDKIIMRLADVMLAFPSLLLAMVVMYTLGSSIFNVFIALSMIGWAGVARVVRSQTLSIKQSEYIEAARSIGVGNGTIIMRHILPNCIPSIIVLFTLDIPSSILSESSLSFLGIGAQPPTASWGLMVTSGKEYLFSQPWICITPAVAIMLIVLAFNFFGDGLRDTLDPYLKK